MGGVDRIVGAASVAGAAGADARAAIALLHQYETALRNRDLGQLSRVWAMGPFDRLLMRQVFRSREAMPVSVDPLSFREAGKDLFVDFDQTSPRMGARATIPLRASLLRRREGEWLIYAIEQRRGVDALGPGPSTNGHAHFDASSPYTALEEFRHALAAGDIQRLSAVWLMNDGEREMVAELFARSRAQLLETEVLDVRVSDDRAIVDFDQRLQPLGTDHLRARLTREADGDWVIAAIGAR
jgi:hypothetical protein